MRGTVGIGKLSERKQHAPHSSGYTDSGTRPACKPGCTKGSHGTVHKCVLGVGKMQKLPLQPLAATDAVRDLESRGRIQEASKASRRGSQPKVLWGNQCSVTFSLMGRYVSLTPSLLHTVSTRDVLVPTTLGWRSNSHLLSRTLA